MNLLTKVLGKREAAPLHLPCPHTALVARWDKAEDMGKAALATAYVCTACGRAFSPEEAAPFRR